jgi:hypothetical protein
VEDTKFFGYFGSTSAERNKAFGQAITTSAVDFLYDEVGSAEYSLDITNEFLSVFPPTRTNRSLSGLWSSLYPNHQQGEADFAEPNCVCKQTNWGVVFCSNRGSLEAVAQIILHLADQDDFATIWWGISDFFNEAPVAALVLEDGEFTETVVYGGKSAAFKETEAQPFVLPMVSDRQKMLGLLFELIPATSKHAGRRKEHVG